MDGNMDEIIELRKLVEELMAKEKALEAEVARLKMEVENGPNH